MTTWYLIIILFYGGGDIERMVIPLQSYDACTGAIDNVISNRPANWAAPRYWITCVDDYPPPVYVAPTNPPPDEEEKY